MKQIVKLLPDSAKLFILLFGNSVATVFGHQASDFRGARKLTLNGEVVVQHC